jgi:hypothetical protein
MCLDMSAGHQVGAEKADAIIDRGRLDREIDGPAAVQSGAAAAYGFFQGILIWIEWQCHGIPVVGKIAVTQAMQYIYHDILYRKTQWGLFLFLSLHIYTNFYKKLGLTWRPGQVCAG